MTKKFKISIIIAIYNSESTIERCLTSVFNQTFQDYELIIIDNNSNDNTKLIINKYISKIHKYIREKDNGIYDAWNKGIKLCNGDWVCFIGSDDYLYPNSLDNLIRGINNNPKCNFISGKIKLLDNKKNLIIGELFSHKKIIYYQNFVHIGSLTSRHLFNDILFDVKYKIAGDYDFYVKSRFKIYPCFVDHIIAESELGVSQISSKVFLENYNIWENNNLHSTLFNKLLFFYQSKCFFLKRKINKLNWF